MILVTGATGNIGSKVVHALIAKGISPRVLVRDPAKAHALTRLGAEVVQGDFADTASLQRALAGISKLYLMTHSSPEQPALQGHIARLAKDAGVAHIVRLSGARCRPDHPARVYRWHIAAEEEIRRTGIPLTSVRPVYFMQNLLSFHIGRSIRLQGQFVGPMAPDFAFNLIDTRDIADVIATCLTEDGHENRAYDLTGPENLSSAEQAARISAAIGRPVHYRHLSVDEFRRMLTGVSLPPAMAEGVIEIHEHLDTFQTDAVRAVTGRPPRTFAEFLTEFAPSLRPPARPAKRAAPPTMTMTMTMTMTDLSPPDRVTSSARRRVLVTGATGLQGGATARALLARGHAVRVLVRTPSSPAATALAALGAELAAGSFDQPAALASALDGVDALFAVTTPFGDTVDPSVEIRQGEALIAAAQRARIGHVVYTSAANADRDTGIPHFASKREVERSLAMSGLRYTILAPVSFMENLFAPPQLLALEDGMYVTPIRPERAMKHIAVDDIGRMAALAIEQPERFAGARIDIAGDERSANEIAAILGEVLGRPIRCVRMEPMGRARSETMTRAFTFLDTVGYDVDIAGLRRAYPEIGWQTFAAFAASLDWKEAQS